MKKTHPNRAAASTFALIAFGAAMAPGIAHATGVTAGTTISNTASATYTSGSANGSVNSNTVNVRVDELLDVAVTPLTTTPATAGANNVVLEYSITNTGNGPEAFKVTVDPAVAGNAFNATVVSIAVDSNGNGTYEPGTDQVITSGSATPPIAADGTLKIFVVVSLPSSATDGQTSQVQLTADAVTGTGTPGTVFAGQGAGGGDAVVGSSTGSDFGNDSLVAALAAVSLAKTASIADPFGGTQPVPGAIVTYTLTASVSGSGDVNAFHITDAFPAGTTYQPGTLRLGSATLTDASDVDAGVATSSGIDVNIGTATGGSTKIVKFNVKIN